MGMLTIEHRLSKAETDAITEQLMEAASEDLSQVEGVTLLEIGPCKLSIEGGLLKFSCSF